MPPLYPFRSAANWGLLYAIFRTVTETPCRRVLEIGAGQTTFLLEAVAKARDLDVTTLEAKREWADLVRGRVAGHVVHSPLGWRVVDGIRVKGFDPSLAHGPFDLLIVDGPFGKKRNSRRTALEFTRQHLAEEFVVIFDDAERRGERDTIQAFQQSEQGRRCDWNWIHGAKDQCVFFTPAYGMLKYI